MAEMIVHASVSCWYCYLHLCLDLGHKINQINVLPKASHIGLSNKDFVRGTLFEDTRMPWIGSDRQSLRQKVACRCSKRGL